MSKYKAFAAKAFAFAVSKQGARDLALVFATVEALVKAYHQFGA